MLLELCRDRYVVHVGFVDERLLERRMVEGGWLHERIAGVSSRLVGLDIAEDGVSWARGKGYEAYAVDVQSPEAVEALGLEPADVVLAGEVIEHLDAPGPFLRAMLPLARPDGLLVVTTPNAYRVLNFVVPASGAELIHQDHTAWHSPLTLRNLLERAGWSVEGFAYYQNRRDAVRPEHGTKRKLAIACANAVRTAVRWAGRWLPYWSDGLIVWARPLSGSDARGTPP